MMTTEAANTSPPKGLTTRKIAGMTDRERILMMRTLRRQKRRVSRELGAAIRELQASFASELENPVDKAKPKEAARRLEKMQRLDAEIIDEKRQKREKVARLEAAFDALLFPKETTTTQEDLFGEDTPVVRFSPEVMETMQTAVASVRVEQQERAEMPEEEREAKPDDFGDENVADLEALGTLLGEWSASMGVAETSIIDEASPDIVDEVVH